MKNSTEALERLHDEIRSERLKEKRKIEEEEWIRRQTTGGGAET